MRVGISTVVLLRVKARTRLVEDERIDCVRCVALETIGGVLGGRVVLDTDGGSMRVKGKSFELRMKIRSRTQVWGWTKVPGLMNLILSDSGQALTACHLITSMLQRRIWPWPDETAEDGRCAHVAETPQLMSNVRRDTSDWVEPVGEASHASVHRHVTASSGVQL